MAYQKKCYRSVDPKTGRHQSRGGGYTTRLSAKKKFVKNPPKQVFSVTYLKACGPRRRPV